MSVICSVESCDRPVKARYLCAKHYQKFWNDGSLKLKPVTFVCSIADCDRPHYSKGLCDMHYTRLRLTSSLECKNISNSIKVDFINNVALKYDSDDCLKWPFITDGHGYGILSDNGRLAPASRYVCEKVHGPPPTPEHQAAHSCGKGHEACINPRHLSWKTRKENEQDKFKHGTAISGERNPNAELTDEDVREIRSLKGKMFQRDIAAKYGVSQPVISDILNGKMWKHLLDNAEGGEHANST